MDMQLKNKIACITGGSVGIGLAIAKNWQEKESTYNLCS